MSMFSLTWGWILKIQVCLHEIDIRALYQVTESVALKHIDLKNPQQVSLSNSWDWIVHVNSTDSPGKGRDSQTHFQTRRQASPGWWWPGWSHAKPEERPGMGGRNMIFHQLRVLKEKSLTHYMSYMRSSSSGWHSFHLKFHPCGAARFFVEKINWMKIYSKEAEVELKHGGLPWKTTDFLM